MKMTWCVSHSKPASSRWMETSCGISAICDKKEIRLQSSPVCHAEEWSKWPSRTATSSGTRRRATHGRAWKKSGNLSVTVPGMLYRGDKHRGLPYDSTRDAYFQQEVFQTVYHQCMQAGKGEKLATDECKRFWQWEQTAWYVQHLRNETVQE